MGVGKLVGAPAKVVALGEGKYKVAVPVASPADEGSTRALMVHRAWYAAQRAGVHIDNGKLSRKADRAYAEAAIHDVAASFGLSSQAADIMVAGARRLLFAEGEVIQAVNSTPQSVGFIAEGTVGLFTYAEGGRQLPLGELGVGDYIAGTALTRQRVITGVIALTDTTIIAVRREAMDAVVQQDPRLARQIGESIEMRRRAAREALAEAVHGVR